MLTHPTAHEIVDGVARWLAGDSPPSGFQLRVARNVLEIAARDMAQSPDADARAAARLRALLGVDGVVVPRLAVGDDVAPVLGLHRDGPHRDRRNADDEQVSLRGLVLERSHLYSSDRHAPPGRWDVLYSSHATTAASKSDRKSTRLNSSHVSESRMPSSA